MSPGLFGGVKWPNIIKFQLQSQFQRFLYQTLCLFTQIEIKNISNRILILSPESCPKGGTFLNLIDDTMI